MSLTLLRHRAAPVSGRVAVAVTDPAVLGAAHRLVASLVAEASHRVDPDAPGSEVLRVLRAGGRTTTVSPLLRHLVEVSLAASAATGGLLDPTVGPAVLALGTDAADRLRAAAAGGAVPVCGRPGAVRPRPAVGAREVLLAGRRLRVPAGVLLDLRATTDAVVAQCAARVVAERLSTGVLVVVGGDAAQAGTAPAGGWTVPLPDGGEHRLAAGEALSVVRPATGRLVDPRTGRAVPADRPPVVLTGRDLVTAKARALATAVGREPLHRPVPAPRDRRAG